MSAVEKEEESPRYSIPSYFNQTPYYVYKAVRQLLDRYDIPLYHIPVKNRFKHYFTKILHFGTNAENKYNNYKKNLPLLREGFYSIECGNIFDEE